MDDKNYTLAGIPLNLIPQLIPKDNVPDNQDISINKSLYIERPPIEIKCQETILQTGALIRINAPQKMGKTWLLENLLTYAGTQGYKTAKLDLKLANTSILDNLKHFLQWMCVNVSNSLDMEANIDKYWQDIYGLNKNCTRYFQKYLLSEVESPLVLAIDNFELLFEYPNIFSEFCKLLRGWYEIGKQEDRVGNIWKKLRLVVVHSTEAYPFLNTNHSPFNVGLAIELPEFNTEQVEAVAKQYQLNGQVGEQGVSQLMELVGGHPYLVQEAFAHLDKQLKNQQNTNLQQILNLAPTEQGIFANHLRQLLCSLQQNPPLKEVYKQLVTANEPVCVDTEVGLRLNSLGLVKLFGNNYFPSCDLYRKYFSARLE